MVIKIFPKFTKGTLESLLKGKLQIVQNAYLERLKYIGEEFVKNARQSGDYTDRTGNLRNSIGYIILKDGKQLVENFAMTAKIKVERKTKSGRISKAKPKYTSGTTEGGNIGRSKALEIASKFPSGFVLICVAGMGYAAAVESKGKDVISSSSIIAKNSLLKAIESLYIKLNKV